MIKKLTVQIKKELVLTARNFFTWLLAVMIIIMMIVVNFLIPKEFDTGERVFYADLSEEGLFQRAFEMRDLPSEYIFDSKTSLMEAVENDPSSFGVIIEGAGSSPKFTIVHRGNIKEQKIRIISATLENFLLNLQGNFVETNDFEVILLKGHGEAIPRNLESVPALLSFEVLVLGFFMIAVFVFQEKSEGSIRAYRISPGGLHLYILSKTLAFMVVGLIYGIFFVLTTVGIPAKPLDFLLITLLGTMVYTLIGFILGILFNNLSEWFFVGTVLLVINMSPIISYTFPTFASGGIAWLPSYHIIFGYKEILFPTGRPLNNLYLMLIILNILSYLISYKYAQVRLMGEER